MQAVKGWQSALLVVAVALLARGALPPYDDAFFFVRFARHIVEHGVPAWNLADGPVHGNTSQLQQALAAGAALVAPEHVIALLRLVAGACLVGAVAVGRGPAAPWLLLGPVGLATLTTGMETSSALLVGAAFLAELHGRGRAGWLGAGMMLLALARPDAALLAAASLGLARRWDALGIGALGVLGIGALAGWVYGSPLPTAFATKLALNDVVDPVFLEKSRSAKLRHLALFTLVALPALGGVERSRWRELLPVAAFVGFHAALVVDVMGMHARFYAPCLPWLAAASTRDPSPRWLAGAALLGVALVAGDGLPGSTGWDIGQIPLPVYLGAAGALGVWAAGRGTWMALPLAAGVAVGGPRPGAPWRTDDEHVAAYAADVTSFRGLDRLVRCLGDELHVAHSEIGVPGMMLREGRVTDLGGLMSPELRTETLDAWCLEARPDAIFLPHRNYAARNRALTEGRCLEGYVRVVERGSSPLYVREDHMAAWRACGR